MLKRSIIALMVISLAGCSSMTVTQPKRSALEEVLISTAADRAASNLMIEPNESLANLTKNGLIHSLGKTFIDGKNFEGYDKAFEVNDKQYAVHAIRRYFLDNGGAIVDDVKEADTILEIALGALSMDNIRTFFGIPQMGLPIPLAGTVVLPEMSIYKKETNRGLAKFAVSFRDAKTGRLKGKSFASVGTAETTDWKILFIDLNENDLKLPKQYESNMLFD